MFQAVRTVAEVRAWRDTLRREGKTLALVPTMGFLHEGHLSLFREAARHADVVAASLFVNPTQFGPSEDLSSYPRDEAGDFAKMAKEGVSLAFAPAPAEVYPEGEETRVEVTGITRGLCGKTRPGHFRGVTTVVLKLFNIFEPDVAVFGEKDFQQLMVIRRMVKDLFLPIQIVGAPLVREADGLALSSRNSYLSADDRKKALGLSKALLAVKAAACSGEKSVAALQKIGGDVLAAHGLIEDYLEVVDAETLSPLTTLGNAPARALTAAYCGKVRLIDNMAL